MTGFPHTIRRNQLLEKGDMMPDRDRYIAGVPCWVDTSQPDPEAALPFYSGLFGWEFENVMPEGPAGTYYIGRIRGSDVAAVTQISEGAPPIATWNTFIWVDNADETADIARKAGGTVMVEPFEVEGAGRMAVISDPEGAVFNLWQAKGHQGAGIVNEHGSLNFNVLAARDIEGSKAFYGAVFGWKTLPSPGGTMWWPYPPTVTIWRKAGPACVSRWQRWVRRTVSLTSSPPSGR